MPNLQHRPKSHVNTNYLPLHAETDMEKSNDPCPPPRSAWRVSLKYRPFILHFALTIIVAAVCLCFLDGHSFNVNSRRLQYLEADGSVSQMTSYAPLQSDVITAVSAAATATRVAGGWWAAGYIWRCIFVAMERGGISLEGMSQVISNWPPAPRHFTRKSNMAIIYITLFATFAIDYFSAVLTGSFVWEVSDRLIPGSVPVTRIQRGVSGVDLTGYYSNPDEQTWIVSAGPASANLAWVPLQQNPTSNITEPSTTFRRVIKGAQYLLTNSTLANVTLPYFIVNAFEWIPDPDQILTEQQLPLIYDYSQFSPYFSGIGLGGLLPDSRWGPPDAIQLGHADPHIVSETRLFTFRVERFTPDIWPCPQNYPIDPGWQIKLHGYQIPGLYTDCFAIANVTYKAGATTCNNCKLISPTVLEAQAPLSLIPDSFTSMALGLTPSLATYLVISNYSVPWNYYTNGTRRDFVIELTSRAYQAAWAAFSDWFGNQFDSTAVEIALPTFRAKVIAWRVYLWVALHLGVLVLGLLFVYSQSHCDHPWVENTTMAIFWLDTSTVPTSSEGQGVDPWQPGTEIRNDGMLVLDKAGQRSRSVKVS